MFLTSTATTTSEVIDRLMDLYVDWREESSGVQLAYDRWAGGRTEDRELAFAAYRAALDREESASRAFSERVLRITRGSRTSAPPARGDDLPLSQEGPAS